MKSPRPRPIFASLKRYGLTQQQIADRFGIDQSTVSHWASGVRVMAPSVHQDLENLAALIAEYRQQGRDARDALQAWRPRSVVTEGGGWSVNPVARQAGPIDLDPIAKELREAKDLATQERLHLENVLDQLVAYRGQAPSRLPMVDLLQAQALALTLESMISMAVLRKAQALEAPRAEDD